MDPATPPSIPAPTLVELCARALARRRREPGEARVDAQSALAAATGAADLRLARFTLGACLSGVAGELLAGRALLGEVLEECIAAADQPLRCRVLLELGSNHLAGSEHEPALTCLRPAVELARQLGAREEEARGLRLIGAVLSNTGGFVTSLASLLDALTLREELDSGREGEPSDEERWERGELFSRIAVVYSNMEQGEQALSYYRVALESFGERFPSNSARTLYRMGIAAEGLEDLERAESFYLECLRRYTELDDTAARGLGLMGLAKMALGRGEVAEAEALGREAAQALAADPVSRSYFADVLWVQGDVSMRAGRPHEALEVYRQALPLYDQFERPAAHRAALHERLSAAHAAIGDYARALEYHQRFHAYEVEHLDTQASARLAGMMAQFDTERALQEREIHRLRNLELERQIAERREAEAALAAAQAELERSNRELHALTIRDPLTGAFNRRYLDQRLGEVMPLAVRGLQPLSVMLCDIDDFKSINDTFSHAVGDQVLCVLASTLREQVRQSDVVARFGGEEFVVLFPATTLDQAVAASEKLCARVRSYPWSALRPGLAVTISAGVASAEGHSSHEKLLREADDRMYQAKRAGKDRVVH